MVRDVADRLRRQGLEMMDGGEEGAVDLDRDECEELRGLFNAVWSAVPEGPGYDGKKWRRLAALVEKAARPPAPAHDREAARERVPEHET
jgi:hypothetical protein